MVNKKGGVFTQSDEKSFEMFAVYCGLALHHAKVSKQTFIYNNYDASTPNDSHLLTIKQLVIMLITAFKT